ncbi:MAG: alpha-amylase family glycosyl hydrolase [Oscillospiraceae bacterium]|nr:alpha-amylase family glycosyl hydrolase [Oscillospiraceae bacterium]
MNFFESAVFYQIYPIGMLGAERDNDFSSPPVSRIGQLGRWIGHLNRIGANAVYLCPVFESSHHGYDTGDFCRVDRRLGTNQDLADFVAECHDNGIRVVLDGVFNHVGRDFWAFRDVIENREKSRYTGWFHINFSGNSGYNDGFWYEGWEGHFELVKLNLYNPEVKSHIFDAVGMWIDDLGIDGLRLDVAYCLNHDFLRELCSFCRGRKPGFWLVGEALHGDYRNLMDGALLDSVTNYECYKGLYSSFNSANMFEIAYSLNRQFGAADWTLYKGRHLFNFADNHDVTRIATILKEEKHLPLIYGLLFTMPGIPCIYYGSEWGVQGDKKDSDYALRPHIETPVYNELTEFIARLAQIHKDNICLTSGDYKELHLTNSQFIFERSAGGERMIIAINIDSAEYAAHFNANAGCGVDLVTGSKVDFGGGLRLPPCSIMIIGVERKM